MDFKYGQGQFVKCVNVTEDNHEGLVLGHIYKVLGAETYEGDVVYAVMDSNCKTMYSIDRFELTNYTMETANTIKIEIPAKCNPVINNPLFSDVDNPKHYTDRNIEVIDYIADNMSFEAMNGWLEGNVIKYISRYKSKNGVQDLKKARFYLDRLIRRMEE